MFFDMLFNRSAIIKTNSKHFKYAKIVIKINGLFRVLGNKVTCAAADQVRFYGHDRIVVNALHKLINNVRTKTFHSLKKIFVLDVMIHTFSPSRPCHPFNIKAKSLHYTTINPFVKIIISYN